MSKVVSNLKSRCDFSAMLTTTGDSFFLLPANTGFITASLIAAFTFAVSPSFMPPVFAFLPSPYLHLPLLSPASLTYPLFASLSHFNDARVRSKKKRKRRKHRRNELPVLLGKCLYGINVCIILGAYKLTFLGRRFLPLYSFFTSVLFLALPSPSRAGTHRTLANVGSRGSVLRIILARRIIITPSRITVW